MVSMTNFNMLCEWFNVFWPRQRGVITGEEFKEVAERLELADRTEIDLHNLRDMVVMYGELLEKQGGECPAERITDKVSAVTAVIDRYIMYLGGEV